MFGHHGSKAAANMIGHLLSYDLKERGIPIAMIHVSVAMGRTPLRFLLPADDRVLMRSPGFSRLVRSRGGRGKMS